MFPLVIAKVMQGTFDTWPSKSTEMGPWYMPVRAHPAVLMLYPSEFPAHVMSAVRLEAVSFPLILRFQSFIELVNTSETPQLKEGFLHVRDTVAQFGPHKEPVRQQIHRMFLLRVKLMHFVNSLHNYIMTRVGVCPYTSVLSPYV